MKRYYFAAIPALLLLAAACRELPEAPDMADLTVRMVGGVNTRAAYDNELGRFQWTAGDRIAVPYAGDRLETYDIRVNPSNPAVATVLSSRKGTDDRCFYAVFPASAWVAPASGASAPVVNLRSSYDEFAGIIAGTSALTADYSPVPMVAVNDPSTKTLDFRHVGGLLRLNCTEMKPETKTVVVTFDKDVTGNYAVNVDDPDEPYIRTAGRGSDNQVTFTVAASDAGVGSGKTDFVLNVPVPCGTYGQVKVEAFDKDGASLLSRVYDEYPIQFDRHHGKRISFTELSWSYHLDGTFTDVDTQYYGGVETITVDMGSYKEDADHNRIPVSFEVQYSPDGTDGTWTTTRPDWLLMGSGIDYTGDVAGQTVTISVAPQANSVPLNTFGVPEDKHTLKLRSNTPATTDLSRYNVATGAVESSTTTANCYVVQAPGTYSFPLVYGNGVKGGAVNEIAYHAKVGDRNSAFRNSDTQVAETTGYDLGYFKDHLGDDLKTPYVAVNLASKSPALTVQKAELLWMDAKGLIESVRYVPGSETDLTDDRISFTVTPEGINQGNAVIAVYDSEGRIAWSWHIWVTDADLTEHNIGGTTKSSYSDHSPDKPEPEDFDKPETFHFAKVNLGWCDAKTTEIYPEQDQYIRFVQDNPDGTVSGTIHLHMTAGPTSSIHGNAPYYQCGRKDPLVTWNGNTHSSDIKAHYPPKSENDHYPRLGVNALPNATIGMSIQHPSYFYYGNNGWTNPLVNGWNPQWNALPASNAYTIPLTTPGSTDPVFHVTDRYDPYSALTGIKSIYDPSPVGYRIPFYNCYYYESFSENDGIVTCVDAAGQPQTFPLLGLVNSSGYSEIHGQCNYYCTYVSDYMESGTKYIIGSHLTVWKDNSRENWHHGAGMSQAFSIRPQVDASQQ